MRELLREHGATLSSDPLGLRNARRWLVRLVTRAGFTSRDAHDLGVAFGEACANVHRHAYRGRRDGRVELRIAIDHERVVVAVSHDGAPFHPSRFAPCDLRRPSENDYGQDLIASLVDEVSFEDTGTGGRVVLVKRKHPAEARA